jgi:hypothetical protein
VSLTVTPAATTITWNTPSAIVYGTALSTAQLNATVDGGIAGTLVYTPAEGVVLNAGTHDLSVTFTPRRELRGVDEDRVADRDAGATTISWNQPARSSTAPRCHRAAERDGRRRHRRHAGLHAARRRGAQRGHARPVGDLHAGEANYAASTKTSR